MILALGDVEPGVAQAPQKSDSYEMLKMSDAKSPSEYSGQSNDCPLRLCLECLRLRIQGSLRESFCRQSFLLNPVLKPPGIWSGRLTRTFATNLPHIRFGHACGDVDPTVLVRPDVCRPDIVARRASCFQ